MMAKTTISRRTLLTMLAGTGAAALVGCDVRRTPTSAPVVTIPDALLVEVDDGLGLLRGADRLTIPDSIATAHGLTIYATAPEGANTAFWRIDTATGLTSTRVTLPGRWAPQAVSATGAKVALTSNEVNITEGRPDGREMTPVLIADAQGVQHRLELRGNFVPEAFTEDLTGLFVLEWLPAKAPDRYRVRVVDLATKVPGPLYTRDKATVPPGAEEEMRGDGRQAVMAPNRRTLYTLYTHQPDHQHTRNLISGRPGNVHAFVHTLDLRARWAYCIDLPHPFGEASASGHAMAISSDGRRLFVADVTSGKVAEISTEELTVRRTVTLGTGTGTGTGTAHAAAGHDRLFIGAGTTVRTVDLARLSLATDWTVREPITGLVLSPDDKRIYVGQTDAVSWHDSATGAELGRVAVPGLVVLRGLAGQA